MPERNASVPELYVVHPDGSWGIKTLSKPSKKNTPLGRVSNVLEADSNFSTPETDPEMRCAIEHKPIRMKERKRSDAFIGRDQR